ncbi:MAG: hypothetical protein HY663_03845 [Chloroflexi bacterium]|nr:hypothetical protein [Chloroflexota bacterium]
MRGQETGIVLKSAEVRDQFPEGVLFQVTAETRAPAQIKEIRLEIRVKGSNRGSYAYLEITPATVVTGKYLLRTSGAQYKPSGTLMEYHFIISDSEQRTLETPAETHLYLDSRFEWSSVSDNLVAVYYYGPTKTRAELIQQASAQAVNKMGALLGIQLSEPVRIIAYNNARDLIPAQPFESQASERELLLEGVTFPEYGTILMIAGVDRPDGVSSHETTHFMVGELTKNTLANIPSWFNEGLAEYGTVNRDSDYDVRLSQAIAQKHLLPLRNMQTPPGISSDRLLMYGQGHAVIKYMIDTYGEDKFRQLFVAFDKGLRIDEALQSVYGFDQDGLDNGWRSSLGLPPLENVKPAPVAPLPAVKNKGAQFAPATLIIVVVGIVIVVLLLGVVLRRRARSKSQ